MLLFKDMNYKKLRIFLPLWNWLSVYI